MTTAKAAGVLSALVLAGLVGAACSTSPSTPATHVSGSSTTVRVPPRQHSTGSTSTTAAAGSPTTAAGTAPGTTPTLGLTSAWARVGPSVAGFGQVKPAEISLGGDPTGLLTGITWQSWGGAVATGTGESTYVAPGQSVAQGSQQQATVEAFDLGSCAGTTAYQTLKWYFPEDGESLTTGANTTINACTGP